MIVLSPAKVNLCLQVTGRDPKDGYHYIKSVFDPVSLYDILDVEILKSDKIIIKDMNNALPGLPTKKNIIYKAAMLLKKESGIKQGALIKYYKFIPDGGGLGGGSSNAAAALKGLNKIWGLNYPGNKLKKLAFVLGADVPFFIGAKRALVEGKGEKITIAADGRKLWYVLAAGSVKVSTKDAYAWVDKDGVGSQDGKYCEKILSALNGNKRLDKADFMLYNAFVRPVLKRNTGIVALIRQLRAFKKGFASMSGSGATVFSLFETKQDAYKCYSKMRKKNKGSFIALVHSL